MLLQSFEFSDDGRDLKSRNVNERIISPCREFFISCSSSDPCGLWLLIFCKWKKHLLIPVQYGVIASEMHPVPFLSLERRKDFPEGVKCPVVVCV